MIQMYTPFKWTIIGAAAFVVIAGPPASAQDATTTEASATTTEASATAARTPRTSATPDMIEEAIQRSLARSERLRTLNRPEQFGSEEPFTFRR
jgi:hypothetical protein